MRILPILKKADLLQLPKYWQKKRSLKTVEVHAKEWFDKVNGNSYYSGKVFVNTGLKNAFSFSMQFDYGYGDYYLQKAAELLLQHNITSLNIRNWSQMQSLKVCIMNSIDKGCLKREVKSYGLNGV